MPTAPAGRVRDSGVAAALFHALSAPAYPCPAPPALSADRTTAGQWGVAVEGELAVDAQGVLHVRTCLRAEQLHPLTPDDLALLDCRQSCNSTYCSAPLIAIGDQTFRDGLSELAWDLTCAYAAYRHSVNSSVFCDHRVMVVCEGSSDSLRRFEDRCNMPPKLRVAVAESRARFDTMAAAARLRLRADGVSRLMKQMSDELSTGHPASGNSPKTGPEPPTSDELLARAQAAVPGEQDGQVACLYRWADPYVDIALDVLPAASRCPARGSSAVGELAVAIVPRSLAVLLHTAAANLLPGGRAALAYAEPVGRDLADAARLCRTAARMWADASDVDPAVIWRGACVVAG